MKVQHFAAIETEFLERVNRIVWCSVTTIDRQQRPRSRILHPIWEGATGWIATGRNSLKAQHLAHNPHMALAYVADITRPVYVDCTAAWADDPADKRHVWDLFLHAPPPMGYDPAAFFGSVDHAEFGVLRLTPWRIDLTTFPAPSMEEGTRVWTAPR
ncbi:MAG: pyridoxamine 5'-phosphate oxidase family protein [Anaerolineae bacterium]|jgi:general stress protein 26|nr:pyridoxamine 5'-phosphate oxidase family protein [Anaerolineae bacterium]